MLVCDVHKIFISKCKAGYQLAMFSFSLLVNSGSIEEVVQHLKHIYTVFGSEFISSAVQTSLNYINCQLQNKLVD